MERGAAVTPDVVVLYYLDVHPLRATIADHLYALGRHARARCHYVNLACRRLPTSLRALDPDVVVLHTSLLSTRWLPPLFERVVERAADVATWRAVKVATPQDEFVHTDQLCRGLARLGVDLVATIASPEDAARIYAPLSARPPRFMRVLTGYLDDATVARIDALAARRPHRDIDVGYRAWRSAFWLGRHGMLKRTIAEATGAAAARLGLRADISLREEDTLLGDAWYEFLLRCHATIGVEGGASILDHDGSVKRRTEAYLASHPAATFDEVEAACFPGLDGTLSLRALSPRHLEACATRTCQVLVEGAYDGVLEPDRHYIPVRPDLSDLERALVEAARPEVRARLTTTAHRDVVASGAWSYRRFAEDVLSQALFLRAPRPRDARQERRSVSTWRLQRALDRASWAEVALRARVLRPARHRVSMAVRGSRLAPVIRALRRRGAT